MLTQPAGCTPWCSTDAIADVKDGRILRDLRPLYLYMC